MYTHILILYIYKLFFFIAYWFCPYLINVFSILPIKLFVFYRYCDCWFCQHDNYKLFRRVIWCDWYYSYYLAVVDNSNGPSVFLYRDNNSQILFNQSAVCAYVISFFSWLFTISYHKRFCYFTIIHVTIVLFRSVDRSGFCLKWNDRSSSFLNLFSNKKV